MWRLPSHIRVPSPSSTLQRRLRDAVDKLATHQNRDLVSAMMVGDRDRRVCLEGESGKGFEDRGRSVA
jgi:hypothetical protein